MIAKKLGELDINKSCGPDQMHPHLLKEMANELSVPLSIIMNKSLQTKSLPKDWKKANVSALFKKGDSKLASNYRPVSLTSIVCKTMEKFVRDHLFKFMFANGLFSDKQFGFLPKRSTVLQLLNIIDEWTMAVDDRNEVNCLYLDFMKAFDTVPHRRLIHKLKSYGICDPILSWIRDFLSDRVQRVIVNGSASQWAKVLSGIPQGSVLGPLLFVIFINDICESINSSSYLFADDTKLFRVIKSNSDIATLQADLNTMIDWSDKWLLRFNKEKCKLLSINGWSNAKYYINSNSEQYEIGSVESEKDIGVTFDTALEFDIHINEKIKKASSICAMIRRSYRFLNAKAFLPLYKALVRSHLEYGNSVWCPYKMKYIDSIEQVQRRATKMLPGMHNLSYKERLQ